MLNKINWSLTLLGGRSLSEAPSRRPTRRPGGQAARRPGGEGFKSPSNCSLSAVGTGRRFPFSIFRF